MATAPERVPAPAPGPESWAVKYGAMASGRFGSKSGFSPTSYVVPTLGQAPEPIIITIEKFQRNNLYGFTSRELGQLDCLPTRELKPGNLQNDILPILQRENWERAPAQPDFTRDHLYPLKNGNGMWSADNDEAWNVMEPIVRLTSRMLTSVHVMPWFDALLNGERKPIPDHRLRPADKNETGLESFHAKGFTREGLEQQRDLVFERLRTAFRLQYGFIIISESPEGPEKDPEEALGCTVTNTEYIVLENDTHKSWRVFVFINLDQPELLMRDGLSSAERLTIEWSVANTIAHETMHAVAALFASLDNKPEIGEPYFEEQALAEVGFGFETTINLGVPEPYLFNLPVPDPPLGYFLRRHWPSYYDVFARDLNTPILTAPGPLTYNEYFPIPITFFQDIQQEDFWSVGVRQFGSSILHYRTWNEGSRINYTVTDEAAGEYKKGSPARFTEQTHYKIWNGQFRFNLKGLETAINLTPDERQAMEFGQKFLISSELLEAFWTDVGQQEANIQSMINTMSSALQDNTPDHVRQVFLSIFTFTQRAITNHERMIAGTISQENAEVVRYPDRRATLLAWNRGTRSFIRQLIQADFRRNLNLDAEELRLEFCRMALWNPNELTTQSGNEWLEIQILQHARQALNNGNSGQCRNLCNRLLQENWRSVFVDCTVQLMMFALDKNMTEGWSDRLAELQNMMGRLDSLRAGAPVYWKDEVLALQTEAAGLIAQPPGIPMQLNFPQQGYTVQGEQEDMNMASPISNSLTESVEE